jgi:hypothetical protein
MKYDISNELNNIKAEMAAISSELLDHKEWLNKLCQAQEKQLNIFSDYLNKIDIK